jgi:hypothetical protein
MRAINPISIFMLISILFHSCSYSSKEAEWTVYNSDEGGFQVEFPGELIHQNQTVGPLQLNIVACDCQKKINSSNFVYMVNHTVYPESFFKDFTEENFQDFFYGLINNYVNNQSNMTNTLMDSKVIDFNGYEGREARVAANNDKAISISTVKWILKENMLYVLIVTTDAKKEPNPDIKRFFDSFKFLNNSKNKVN